MRAPYSEWCETCEYRYDDETCIHCMEFTIQRQEVIVDEPECYKKGGE